MGNTTFTVRLADIQPVVPNDAPRNAEYTIDKHIDFAVNGSLIIGYDDRWSRYLVNLEIAIPEETIASVADLLSADTITLSATVPEEGGNIVRIALTPGA